MGEHLSVWWDGKLVGDLALNQYGEPEFTYANTWTASDDARAISVSLPLRAEPFNRRETLPFFEGLLPEAAQRTAIAQALGVSERNEFRLLEELGGDIAGALEIWPVGETPPTHQSAPTNEALSDEQLVDLIKRLPTRPMLAGEQAGLRLSLAGAQSKLPVTLSDGKVTLPTPGQPTTHILKPAIPRFDGTAENEALCMTLAGRIGLDVATTEYRTIGDTRFLLIERYDRSQIDNGNFQRLHQEDFCQALGKTSAQKYAVDGGPVFRDCFALVRRATARPAAEVLKLLDAALFNTIIGNADAHAKNFSLLHKQTGTELSPLYDLLSTIAYPDLSPRYAMKIAKRRTLDEISADDWSKFAEDIEMRPPYVKRRVSEIAQAILEKVGTSLEALALPEDRARLATSYANTLKSRASSVLEALK
jgi:serine/threonine-protein kinase HipA